MKVLMLVVFILIFLTGCSGGGLDFDQVRDERMQEGCITYSANGTSYLKMASGEVCKTICTPDLPDNFEYSYDRNGCEVYINNGQTKVQE